MEETNTNSHINNFLNSLHLDSEVYYVGQLYVVWHMSTPRGDGSAFHLVCNGEVWIHMTGGSEPIHSQDGYIAFFPHYAAHTFSGKHYVPEQASLLACAYLDQEELSLLFPFHPSQL